MSQGAHTLITAPSAPPADSPLSHDPLFKISEGRPPRSNRSCQGGPDILNGNNIFFSRIEVSYDCHVGLLLLSISSLSPHDAWSNGFKLKGKKPMLPSDAERSRLGRVASPDV